MSGKLSLISLKITKTSLLKYQRNMYFVSFIFNGYNQQNWAAKLTKNVHLGNFMNNLGKASL